MRELLISLLLIPLLAVQGCAGGASGKNEDATIGSEDTVEIPKEELPTITKQEAYTQADFLSKIEADADLGKLWNKLQSEGYTTLTSCGMLEQDDGVKIYWGETGGSKPVKGLINYCDKSECKAYLWGRSSDRKIAFENAAGKADKLPAIGIPILLKQLEGHGEDKPTHTWQGALELPEELPEIDVSKRRFYLVSAFGPVFASGSLDASALAQDVQKSGTFDLVEHYPYVRTEEIDDILTHAHPFDVLVWLGQGIREEAKTNTVYKPIGVTVNSGIVGELRYSRTRLVDKVGINPLQGPGLIVLAACESMGDGNGGGELDKAIPKDLDNKARVLVGFEKCGDARDILSATHLFVKHYVGGETLSEAIAHANSLLVAAESKARMTTLKGADGDQRFLGDVSKFWDSYSPDGTPGESTFMANLNIVNKCTGPDGKTYQENEAFVSPWANNVKWSGPFFSGNRTNPDNKVDLTLKGALLEIEEGAHFFFVVSGSFSPKVQDIVVYGNGVINKIVVDKKKPDEFKIEFKGQGVASPYFNEAGDKCMMQNPYLVSSTGEPSQMTLPVSWGGE